MKTFKMYVKTVIYNEQNKILILNKIKDNKPNWDLPGATFTEEQSFDETIINNVQKEIGYYVYPGKIIGVSDYSNREVKEVNVIMEGNILNGDLLLSKDYETYAWVPLDRITDYPLVPWLKNYLHNNKNPFGDVEIELEEMNSRSERKQEFIQEDKSTNINFDNNSEKINKGLKSSFSLLKDTIIRTFHPQEANVTRTTPKSNKIYHEPNNEKDDEKIMDKLNINFKQDKKDEYLEEIVLTQNENDIIIEHDDDDIIIDHTSEDTVNQDIIINDPIPKENKILKPNTNKKIFDMNINRQKNMKNSVNKIKKVIKNTKATRKPEIKVIHKNDKIPHIRTEKESRERVSFNSENIERNGWKERLNRINRTDANNQKKEAPRPKGRRK